MTPRPVEILLVEDNLSEVQLTREALNFGKVQHNLHVARDGIEALEFLRGSLTPTIRPDLVLLDLNLPRKDGREVLDEIKADDDLRTIPVVVLTTSKAEDDVLRSYASQANCFITKPIDLDQFVRVILEIETFWLSVVTLTSD